MSIWLLCCIACNCNFNCVFNVSTMHCSLSRVQLHALYADNRSDHSDHICKILVHRRSHWWRLNTPRFTLLGSIENFWRSPSMICQCQFCCWKVGVESVITSMASAKLSNRTIAQQLECRLHRECVENICSALLMPRESSFCQCHSASCEIGEHLFTAAMDWQLIKIDCCWFSRHGQSWQSWWICAFFHVCWPITKLERYGLRIIPIYVLWAFSHLDRKQCILCMSLHNN